MFPIGGAAGSILAGVGMAGRAGALVGRAGGFIARHPLGIGLGMAGLGVAGGTMKRDRGFGQSLGGGLWGGIKGGVAGGILGGGIGAGIGFAKFPGPLRALGMLGFGSMGATIGASLLGGFGALKGGLGSNRPVNRIRGLHH